jgi:hypothetical protein
MVATSKYYITSSPGSNLLDFDLAYGTLSLAGQEYVFSGTTSVDNVFVRPGIVFDFTGSAASADKLYLTGNYGHYAMSLAGTVMTLTRTVNQQVETVKVSKLTSVLNSDKLVFADGTVSTFDLYAHLNSPTTVSAPVPSAAIETSLAPSLPTTLNATVKAYAVDSLGENFAPVNPGMNLVAIGSAGVDVAYIKAGSNVDASSLGGGFDKIYLTGNWVDYTKTIVGTNLVFERTVGTDMEYVKVAAATGSSNDVLVFADGTVRSNDAKIALQSSISIAATSITTAAFGTTAGWQGGWSTSEVTPVVTTRTIADLDAEFNATGVQPVAVSIADTTFNLVGGGFLSSYITAGVAVNVIDTISIAELALIDAANGTAALNYSLLADSQANLSSSSYIKSGVNVTVIDNATIAQLNAFDGANGAATVTATSITDTAANLAPGGVVSSFITSGVAVNVTDPIPLVDLAAIDAANGGGALTYVGVSGTLSQLNASMVTGGYLDPNNPAAVGVAVVVSNTASMSDLFGVEQSTGLPPIATSIADTVSNLTVFSRYITPGVNVMVTDVITIAELAVIDAANGGGVLSYSLADTQANLSVSAYLNTGVDVTVTGDATIAQLNALNVTNGAAIVTATSITDTAANLVSGGVVSPFITSGVAVNVIDAISLTDLAAIDASNGTGALTYAGVSGTLSQITAGMSVGGYVVGGMPVTVTDAVSLADLSGIQVVTGVQPVATSIADIAGNLIPGGVASAYITDGVAVTVTNSISVDDLVVIDTANGAASVAASAIADVSAKLVSGGVVSSYINTGVAVNVTDTISIADLMLIDAANGTAALTYAGIVGTLSEVTPYVANGVAVTVTDAVTVQNLVSIQAITGIKPVATVVADTATNLLTDGLGGSTNYVMDGVAVTVTNSISIADLVKIDTTNGGAGVTVVSLTDTSAQLLAARTTYISSGVALTVTDAISISDLTLLDNANNGATGVTLTSIADTAANLAPGEVPSAYVVAGVPVAVTDSITLTSLSALDTANGSATVSYAGIANTSGTAVSSDVLQFSSALNTINFVAFNQSGQPALQGFEIFDMATDTGANAVTLTAASMFLQTSNLSNATAEQVLTVNGGANDTVTLSAGGFVSLGGAFNADGSVGTGYNKYVASYTDVTSHSLEVLVQTGVVVL